MIVYIEYVLIDNFIIDYLILKATFTITGEIRRKGRLFLCAFLGSIFSLTYPLIEKYFFLSIVFKISCGLLVMLLSGKFRSKKDFLFNALAFFGLTFVYGGSVIAIRNILGIEENSEFLVATIVFPVYLVYRLTLYIIKYIYSKKEVCKFTYKTEIDVGEKSFSFVGFLDSGNGVYYNGKPVIFCSKKVAEQIIKYIDIKSFKKIKIQTINGIDIKNAFTTHLIKIYSEKGQYIYNDAIICISSLGFNLNYDLILHPKLISEGNENETIIKTKKSS